MFARLLIAALIPVVVCAQPAAEKPKGEVGPDGKPVVQITSKDMGPDIDPAKLAASRFSGVPLFATFRSFMSGSYAIAGVWVYAENDDPAIYDARVAYVYPDFYTPTWGELFDHLARQIRGRWEFDTTNRQFKFSRPKDAVDPPFGVELAPGWRREDRGLYVWHAPAGGQMGMDVYDLGHYTPANGDKRYKDAEDLAHKARRHAATYIVGRFPEPPAVEGMERVRVAGVEALYLRMDTPRPGGVWRQWAIVKDGHAYLIVSAMDKADEPKLGPAVDQMVKTFKTAKAPAPAPEKPNK